MTSIQPFTQPQFQIRSLQTSVYSEIKKDWVVKWKDTTIEKIKKTLSSKKNKTMLLLEVFKELDNKNAGMNEREFAEWWNDNKDNLND